MAFSLSHNKPLDSTGYGYTRDDLPGLDDGPVELKDWFPADRRELPLELEIGSGKGTFLVQQAVLEPEVNFLGLEYAKAFWRHSADRMRRHALANVRMLHGEAGEMVRNYIPKKYLHRVHIYFPDPWPKKKHNKRRLIQAGFLRQLHEVICDGGDVRIATDHVDYFEWMCEHVSEVTDIFDRQPFEKPVSAGEGELVGTNFERKYRREGRPFNAMILMKK